MKQPFFILGIDDVDKAKGSAFGAAAAFFFTFLVSIVYLLCEGSPALAPAQTQGRGHVHRFGEYSNVGFSDLPDADIISENNQGSFA